MLSSCISSFRKKCLFLSKIVVDDDDGGAVVTDWRVWIVVVHNFFLFSSRMLRDVNMMKWGITLMVPCCWYVVLMSTRKTQQVAHLFHPCRITSLITPWKNIIFSLENEFTLLFSMHFANKWAMPVGMMIIIRW